MFIGMKSQTNIENVENCIECGMAANIDPWLHEERYKHPPVVLRDGQRLVHDGTGVFVSEDIKRTD
ncbi:hypothetical protein [Microbulbifer epialgicus]|uniref:Uncharacterized protein n=1 Tax=Microbulbifer epialgicus TaxID=393907 RepID=A0ABV4NTD8_9GAMM